MLPAVYFSASAHERGRGGQYLCYARFIHKTKIASAFPWTKNETQAGIQIYIYISIQGTRRLMASNGGEVERSRRTCLGQLNWVDSVDCSLCWKVKVYLSRQYRVSRKMRACETCSRFNIFLSTVFRTSKTMCKTMYHLCVKPCTIITPTWRRAVAAVSKIRDKIPLSWRSLLFSIILLRMPIYSIIRNDVYLHAKLSLFKKPSFKNTFSVYITFARVCL